MKPQVQSWLDIKYVNNLGNGILKVQAVDVLDEIDKI